MTDRLWKYIAQPREEEDLEIMELAFGPEENPKNEVDIAKIAAQDVDGDDDDYPMTIHLFHDDQYQGTFSVDLEYSPVFSAVKVDDEPDFLL